ncbi:guanine deaminase [Georgenia satyanarayanai]|uniref:guanine deaminase n=1 Tax=Georgenia satyanarayanai TaxID=860221 RepID=UPI00203DA186|nr:guanine deaminase [Georgenia satyanarayanai]MCM3660632.1 guanine deaminase [Georgenia satyanarayanai]
MTIIRATVLDTPGTLGDPDGLRSGEDVALVVRNGTILARTDVPSARAAYPQEEVLDLRDGVLLPGFVDTHVHYPQVRVIGGLGMTLLDWLRECALPEEARLADQGYARGVARDFLGGLLGSGTTTALVFGSHFAGAMDALFAEAVTTGQRITSGMVLSDRILRGELLQSPAAALEASEALARRWHGRGRLRYAVTPRFSLSTTEEMLEVCAELLTEDRWFTSHLNENPAEVAEVARLFPTSIDYLDTYARHGLATERSVFAHNVHPTDRELDVLAGAGCAVAHCPSSNSALGSGLFPLRRHLDAGVRVALGSDVGAGTGFCLLKEGLQAYFVQQLLGGEGAPLATADLLHLATRSGALALGMGQDVGDLSPGRQFDAVWVRPRPDGTLAMTMRHATDPTDALAKIFALGSPADIAGVWVGGHEAFRARPTTAGVTTPQEAP